MSIREEDRPAMKAEREIQKAWDNFVNLFDGCLFLSASIYLADFAGWLNATA